MPSPPGPWQAAQNVRKSVAGSIENSRSPRRSARTRSIGHSASVELRGRSEGGVKVPSPPRGGKPGEPPARETRPLHPRRTAGAKRAASPVEAVTGQAVATLEKRDLSIHLALGRDRQGGVAGSAPGRGEAQR